jgi:hypothetical protein
MDNLFEIGYKINRKINRRCYRLFYDYNKKKVLSNNAIWLFSAPKSASTFLQQILLGNSQIITYPNQLIHVIHLQKKYVSYKIATRYSLNHGR